MVRRFNSLKLVTIVWSLLLVAIGWVLGGIIGNRSDAIFLPLWPKIAASINANTLLWASTGILIVLSLSIIWGWLNDREKLSNLLSFDTTLDIFLVEAISSKNPQNIVIAFTRSAVDVTRQYLTNPHKALLLLKDAHGQHLIRACSFGWTSQNNNTPMGFPINHNNSDRSTAAEAFKTKDTIIVHVDVKNGNSQGDHASYRPSVNNSLPFRGSLICIPLIVGEASNDCLGVVCFESSSKKEFNTPNTRKTLQLLARHIASAIQIQQSATQSLPSQATP